MYTRNYEIIIYDGTSGKTLFKGIVNSTYDKATEKAEKIRFHYSMKHNKLCLYSVKEDDSFSIDNSTISTIRTDYNGNATLTIYQAKEIIFEKTYKSFSSAKKAETQLLKKIF